MTKEEFDAEWGHPDGRKWQPTGRMIWLAHTHYDSPFGEHTGPRPESWYQAECPVGTQQGTYFKTTKTHEGMTVWLWGGRHPDDVAEARANMKTADMASFDTALAALGSGI